MCTDRAVSLPDHFMNTNTTFKHKNRRMAAHVAFVANEGYVKGLAVTLKSLLDSLRSASTVGAAGELSKCLQSVPLLGPAVQLEAVSTMHVWVIDTGLHDESWRKLEGMVQNHNQSTLGRVEPQAPQLEDGVGGSCCSARSPDRKLQQTQAHVPAVQLHRIPAGAAVVLANSPAALPANISTCTVVDGTAQIARHQHRLAGGTSTAGTSTDCKATGSSSHSGDKSDLPPEVAANGNTSSCSSCCTEHLAVTYHLPPCDQYASQFCWLKLLLPWLLPAEVEFVLYLDCDMLVVDNPCGLLQEASAVFKESPNTLLAAVRDFGLPCGHKALLQLPGVLQDHPEGTTSSCTDPTLSSCISWSSTSPYFNAGLLLYNLKAWREQGALLHSALLQFGFRVEQCVGGSYAAVAAQASGSALDGGSRPCTPQKFSDLLWYSDQDALNLLCCAGSGWVELGYCWNVQGIGTYLRDRIQDSDPRKPALFTAASAAQLEASPSIIHFTGPPTITPSQLLNKYVSQPSKPWVFVCLNPWKDAWYRVLDTTPWAGWRPQQLGFEQAAVQEILGLCRLLKADVCDAAVAEAAVVDSAERDAVLEGLHAVCVEEHGSSQQSGGGSEDRSGHDVDNGPLLLTGVEGAATQHVGSSSKTGAGASCVTPTSPHTGGRLAPAVCGMRGFDAQSFLRSVAELCLAAADSEGLRLSR